MNGKVKCYSAIDVGGKKTNYYLAEGVFLRVYGTEEMTRIPRDSISLRELPQEFKRHLRTTVRVCFGEETSGFVLALLTGDREELSQQQTADLEEAGLMHLTAVSGLHCTFLVSLIRLLLGGNRRLTALIGYPILVFYMVVVGGTPSVVRACIMIGFLLAAPLFQRENDPPTALAAAAFVILLENPFAAMSVSFQLSFGAVLGLMIFSPPIAQTLCELWKPRRSWMQRIWTAISTSVASSISVLALTAPISAYYFKTIALISPVSNLLVLVVIESLFACALVVSLLCMVTPMFTPLATVLSVPVRYVLCVAGWTAELPGHAISFCDGRMTMWLIFVYGIFLICWVSGDGRRKYVFAAGIAVLTLVVVQRIPIEVVRDDVMTVVSVDVGQGAATLIHSGDKTALVDCGSVYCQRGSGASAADVMRQYGWQKLSYVVLTHYHEDHAGGLGELLARISVETLLLPWQEYGEDALYTQVMTLAEQYGISVRYLYKPMEISLGDAGITLYPPLTSGSTNEEGLTVLCSAKDFDLLITGDMGTSTEKRLIEQFDLPDIEVLFVGHHGSTYATSHELLKA
ncbi:MAG: ComEC/Rec2 family competence protein, partial [Oscillospiraceae bacterium]|nr:ComEC/Rec2 family competence protein [Oscillospiraceae bacterium]